MTLKPGHVIYNHITLPCHLIELKIVSNNSTSDRYIDFEFTHIIQFQKIFTHRTIGAVNESLLSLILKKQSRKNTDEKHELVYYIRFFFVFAEMHFNETMQQ